MNDEQFERFKEIWESYGVSFTHDNGTYKSTYEVLKEMSQVFNDLQASEKDETTKYINKAKDNEY